VTVSGVYLLATTLRHIVPRSRSRRYSELGEGRYREVVNMRSLKKSKVSPRNG